MDINNGVNRLQGEKEALRYEMKWRELFIFDSNMSMSETFTLNNSSLSYCEQLSYLLHTCFFDEIGFNYILWKGEGVKCSVLNNNHSLSYIRGTIVDFCTSVYKATSLYLALGL